ncbi:MAG TPA: methylated-DNA--[protein]-cysteine S-methyltransferase [Capsulimonadaceae bacterium]|nr:methylated-DNA--[protein]-cysteine S-methyltransferase [Capsulimonadaceae bacterium]
MTFYTTYESPIGPLLLVSNGEALTQLWLPKNGRSAEPKAEWTMNDDVPPFAAVRQQLEAYFEGQLTQFDLPLAPKGDSFQQKVWQELVNIPYGETTSYGAIARKLGDVALSRAVGSANGSNPIAIIVPCHRVIGSNGKLVGYAGGLETKKALLDFEASVAIHGTQTFAESAGELSLVLA